MYKTATLKIIKPKCIKTIPKPHNLDRMCTVNKITLNAKI